MGFDSPFSPNFRDLSKSLPSRLRFSTPSVELGGLVFGRRTLWDRGLPRKQCAPARGWGSRPPASAERRQQITAEALRPTINDPVGANAARASGNPGAETTRSARVVHAHLEVESLMGGSLVASECGRETGWGSSPPTSAVAVAELVKAADCGSVSYGFESHRSPHTSP